MQSSESRRPAFRHGRAATRRIRHRRRYRRDVEIPEAPFFGSKVVEIKDLTKVFAFINETALFKGQWQYKQGSESPEEYQRILQDETFIRDLTSSKPKRSAINFLKRNWFTAIFRANRAATT